jgi:beta-lactamase regulating signal transducer with metallopeptidase domain
MAMPPAPSAEATTSRFVAAGDVTSPAPLNPLPAALTVAWFIGFSAVAGRLLLAARQTSRIVRGSTTIDGGLTDESLLQLSVSKPKNLAVEIRVSQAVPSPAVVGVLKSTVLLPSHYKNASIVAMRSALLHEFAHGKRRDYAWNLILEGAKAVFWFNPFIWLVVQEHRTETEIAADRLASDWMRTSARTYGVGLLEWIDPDPRRILAQQTVLMATDRLPRRLKALGCPSLTGRQRVATSLILAIPAFVALFPATVLARISDSNPADVVVRIPARPGTQKLLVGDEPVQTAGNPTSTPQYESYADSPLEVTALRNFNAAQPEGKTYQAKLPGGGMIELIGISSLAPRNHRSWAADGTPYPQLLPFTATAGLPPRVAYYQVDEAGDAKPVPSTDAFLRQALIRYRPGTLAAVAGQFVPSSGVMGRREPISNWASSNNSPVPGHYGGGRLVSIEQSFRRDARRADLEVIYFEQPQVVATLSVNKGQVTQSPLTPEVKLPEDDPAVDIARSQLRRLLEARPEPQKDGHPNALRKPGLDATPPYGLIELKNVDPSNTYRVKVVLKDGQVVAPFNITSSRLPGSPRVNSFWEVNDVTKDQIAGIQILKTRERKVVFKGVQLHPIP